MYSACQSTRGGWWGPLPRPAGSSGHVCGWFVAVSELTLYDTAMRTLKWSAMEAGEAEGNEGPSWGAPSSWCALTSCCLIGLDLIVVYIQFVKCHQTVLYLYSNIYNTRHMRVSISQSYRPEMCLIWEDTDIGFPI